MQLCYVDESGKADTLTRDDHEQQPVVVIGGISLREENLTGLTHDWIELKRRFTPSVTNQSRRGWLDGIMAEPKGTSIRRGFKAKGTKRQNKNSIGYIDGLVRLLERYARRSSGGYGSRAWTKRAMG